MFYLFAPAVQSQPLSHELTPRVPGNPQCLISGSKRHGVQATQSTPIHLVAMQSSPLLSNTSVSFQGMAFFYLPSALDEKCYLLARFVPSFPRTNAGVPPRYLLNPLESIVRFVEGLPYGCNMS